MGLFTKGQALPLKKVQYNLSPDCHVWLRELSSTEMLHYHAKMKPEGTAENRIEETFDLLAKCICDELGKALFVDGAEVKSFFDVGLSVIMDIQKTILDLSGLEKKV